MSVSKTAMTFAILLGGFHLMWSCLVLLGWAQAIIDFIISAHMLSIPVVVKAFDATASATLIVITAAIGWVFGYAMAVVWNRLHGV